MSKIKQFNEKEEIGKIVNYLNQQYFPETLEKKKVFYRFEEWFGWRFYKKAITNLDFKSILYHWKNRNLFKD